MRATNKTSQLTYDIKLGKFNFDISDVKLIKYLKMVFPTIKLFKKDFIDPMILSMKMHDYEWRKYTFYNLYNMYTEATPMTYEDAFLLPDSGFKSLVFSAIDISEMIENLGSERREVEGMQVKHRIYNPDGTYKIREYDVVYELHDVDCSKLGINENLPIIKCWCTSTDDVHWLWIKPEFADNGPLEAIASTCIIYKNMLPHIKCIKRHGDVFLFEMTSEILPGGETMHLNKEQYFRLLVAQS